MDTSPEITPEVTVIPPGGGEVIGDAPDRTVLVLADTDPLAATWTRFGPGRDGADLHIHHLHTDLFYVLAGELTIRLGVEDTPVAVAAGRLVRVPPYVVHGFRNASDAEVTYLNLHAPGQRFIDFMRGGRDGRPFEWDQHEPPEDGGRSTSEAVIGEPVADIEAIEIAEIEGVADAPAGDRLECRFILEGERAGTWIQIPPGTDWEGGEAFRYLRIRTPAG